MTARTAILLSLISEQIRDADADGILPLTRAERAKEEECQGFARLTSRPRPMRRKPRRTDHARAMAAHDAWEEYTRED